MCSPWVCQSQPALHSRISCSIVRGAPFGHSSLQAKISGFELMCESYRPGENVMGTPGYIDPSYVSTRYVSPLLDVFRYARASMGCVRSHCGSSLFLSLT